jgi:hypothetical protein
MEEHSLDRLYGRSVVLDICRSCQGMWFDNLELLQLTPGATLRLFAALNDRAVAARVPLSDGLACPRCPARLVEAHDRQRNTRFSYFRCPAGHGRYLTFFQFLRAKNFVRSLDPQEIAELRRRLRQVNCANCGAPVDVERHAACGFCRSPVSMIDPDRVRKVVDELNRAEARRIDIDPTLPVQLLVERARAERAFAEPAGEFTLQDLLDGNRSPNLIDAGLRVLARWIGAHGSHL